jgi:hypothetical protein
MNQKIKLFTIIMISVVAGIMVYMPLTQALESNQKSDDEIIIAEIQQNKSWRRTAIRIKLAWWFMNNSEPMEIEGTAVNLSNNMLIVSTTEDQIRVHLPQEWTVGTNIIQRGELFTSSYLSEGEDITVKALEATLINKEGLRISLLVGYEIISKSNVHAYANLRVNIED